MLFYIPNDPFDSNAFLILIIMISVHTSMHGIVSEFNRVMFELRSAHLYPESELLLVTRQMTLIYKDLWCGVLVPRSHQRGKLSYTILCTVS